MKQLPELDGAHNLPQSEQEGSAAATPCRPHRRLVMTLSSTRPVWAVAATGTGVCCVSRLRAGQRRGAGGPA